MSVELAGKIAIFLSLLLTYLGTILLDRQLNGDNWGLSLFAGIFLYSGALRIGFINYVIGIGFAICGFWMWVRYREKAPGTWIIAFTLAGLVVLCIHLTAFGIYAVCVASYEGSLLWERLKAERQLRFSLFAIPISATASVITPCLFLFWFSPISNNPNRPIWVFSQYASKVEGLAAPIFYSEPVVEIPLLFVVFVLFAWALATRTIVANSRMIFPLIVFGVVFLVMPFNLLGSEFADYRLPSGVAFIALASLGWGKTTPTRKALRSFLGVCLVIRIGSVISSWQPVQAVIQEYYTALQVVPPGSRLLVYVAPIRFADRNPPLRHVPALAAAMHGVFDPDTFANAGLLSGSQLLNLKGDYRDYWIDDPPSAERMNDIRRFDYLIVIRGEPVNVLPGISLKEIKRGRTFVLYRIDEQAQ